MPKQEGNKPFKAFMDAAAVGRLADLLIGARPDWDGSGFAEMASTGLDALELKDRIRHVSAALQTHLDPDFPTAVAHVLDSLPPAIPVDEGLSAGWEFWPLCQWVENAGIDHWRLSMDAMRELTQRWSCEFAVRPFLIRYPEQTLAQLADWAGDDNAHIRRWVSEGTRPRLPWGIQLKQFVADPAPVIELLELLKSDSEEYVRRSVANNLNDIAKDHPDVVVEVTRRWMKGGDKNRVRLVKHALRTLIKQGNPGALDVLGFGSPKVRLVQLSVATGPVSVGEKLAFSVEIESTTGSDQPLIIDYAVHHMRANGKLSPKVFKWSTRTLKGHKTLRLERQHSLKKVTTRRYYNGEHLIEVLVNGQSLGRASFELRGADA